MSITTPYAYRKAILEKEAEPAHLAATPNLSDVATQYASAQGSTQAAAAELTRDTAFSRDAMAEKGRQVQTRLAETGRQATGKLTEEHRQYLARLDDDRKFLDTWAEQNQWATRFAVANLGIQALGIPAAKRTIAKQEAHEANLADLARRSVSAQEQAILDAKERRQQEDAKNKAWSIAQGGGKAPI
jgi:hypothetical protein